MLKLLVLLSFFVVLLVLLSTSFEYVKMKIISHDRQSTMKEYVKECNIIEWK